MTDTTDIKALREASEIGESSDYMTWPKVDPAKLKRVLDQLEAERQRADNLSLKNSDLHHDCTVYRGEIAALKGDQVPVVWKVTTPSGSIVFHTEEQDMDGHSYYGNTVTPLFTAPQKPVVLPHGHKPYLVRSQTTAPRAAMTANGDWLHRVQVIEAIEAAGGIVKDGE